LSRQRLDIGASRNHAASLFADFGAQKSSYVEDGEMIVSNRNERRNTAPASARADRKQDFLAESVFELLELQGRLALVAQHLEHGRPCFLRHFDASIFQVDHMHLQRFDLKIPVVAALWTGQRHEQLPPSPRGSKRGHD
jgi:hypothetical protein